MTKRKNLHFGLIFLTLCMLFVLPVWADAGDKPSIYIAFENIPNVPIYGTLIVDTLPPSASYTDESEKDDWYAHIPDAVYTAFCAYADADGFFYWHSPYENLFLCSESGRLVLNYPSPDIFKLLLYFPETDSYAVSDVLEKYAHDDRMFWISTVLSRWMVCFWMSVPIIICRRASAGCLYGWC
ncbi:MAG: hypothetical protein E7604_06330 [Ruminococcaceae bacterium]|nr:hypothetical protein [Oscillospiraceae bacterium]